MIISGTLAVTVMAHSIKADMRVPAAFEGRTVLNSPHVTEKVVALTFDDGPSPFTTPSVLNALKKHKAKATFFVVGQMVKGRESLLKRMVAEGHIVGNHSFSHPYHPNEVKAAYELRMTNLAVHKATGSYPTVFRPPGGVMDSWTARIAKSKGMASVIWTGSSADTSTSDSNVVYRNVVGATYPGAIILMHDVKYHTAAAVPAILKTLKKRGYRFVTVPQMLRIWEAAREKERLNNLAKKNAGSNAKDS